MTNLTLSLDEVVVRQARVRAIGEGTSVSAQIRQFLQQYAAGESSADAQRLVRKKAAADLMRQIRKTSASIDWTRVPAISGKSTREELYDRPYPGKYGAA